MRQRPRFQIEKWHSDLRNVNVKASVVATLTHPACTNVICCGKHHNTCDRVHFNYSTFLLVVNPSWIFFCFPSRDILGEREAFAIVVHSSLFGWMKNKLISECWFWICLLVVETKGNAHFQNGTQRIVCWEAEKRTGTQGEKTRRSTIDASIQR